MIILVREVLKYILLYCFINGLCEYFFCTCNRILINEIYDIIRLNFEWIIFVDIDEFITSNDNQTIKQKFLNIYENYHCIIIPWIMMSPIQENNPKSILQTNIYRHNYDNIEFTDEKEKFEKKIVTM